MRPGPPRQIGYHRLRIIEDKLLHGISWELFLSTGPCLFRLALVWTLIGVFHTVLDKEVCSESGSN